MLQKMTKKEIVNNLKNKNLEVFGNDLEELADWFDTTVESITTETYEWGFAHVAEMLFQNHPERYTD